MLEVDQNFTIERTKIPAGKYAVYAFPRKGEMELRINSETNRWGYAQPDVEYDIAIFVVPMEIIPKVEQFTITTEATEGGADIVFEWDTYRWLLTVLKD